MKKFQLFVPLALLICCLIFDNAYAAHLKKFVVKYQLGIPYSPDYITQQKRQAHSQNNSGELDFYIPYGSQYTDWEITLSPANGQGNYYTFRTWNTYSSTGDNASWRFTNDLFTNTPLAPNDYYITVQCVNYLGSGGYCDIYTYYYDANNNIQEGPYGDTVYTYDHAWTSNQLIPDANGIEVDASAIRGYGGY